MGYFTPIQDQPLDIVAATLAELLKIFIDNLKNPTNRQTIVKALNRVLDSYYNKTKSNEAKLKASSFKKYLNYGYSKSKTEALELKKLVELEI